MYLKLQNVPYLTKFYILAWLPEITVGRYDIQEWTAIMCVCVCLYMKVFFYKITFELN